jgi:hypothetical protein
MEVSRGLFFCLNIYSLYLRMLPLNILPQHKQNSSKIIVNKNLKDQTISQEMYLGKSNIKKRNTKIQEE